ncbi:MAG TPA: LysE family transporter [Firmicutes bacterium]|nr:LysE family transporter [Bacillota bacterium]
MTPGPLLTVVISNTAAGGFLPGISPIMAHGLLEAVMVGALRLGLGVLLSHGLFRRMVALAGGLALLYMGCGMVRSAPKLIAPTKQQADRPGTRASSLVPGLLGGLVATASSPFWFLWWATIGASTISMGGGGPAAASSFFIGHFSADLAWYSLVAGAIILGRRALTDKVYRSLIGGCGVFLVCMGLFYLWNGFRP